MLNTIGEGWLTGIVGARLSDRRPMPPAIFRHYAPRPDSSVFPEVLPHQDDIRAEVDDAVAQAFVGQLGANLYLSLPEEGGELLLYDTTYGPDQFRSLAGDSYGISWELAGSPVATIRPEVGELILINVRWLHAVAACKNGTRLTLSSFIGVLEPDRPLQSWA